MQDRQSLDPQPTVIPAGSVPGKPWPTLVLALVFAIAGVAALAVDFRLSLWCVEKVECQVASKTPGAKRPEPKSKGNSLPQPFARILSLAEHFGHALGVIFVALLIYLLDPGRRWALTRVVGVALAAGGLADVGKLLIARIRPNFFDFHGDVLGTFGGWLPLFQHKAALQSFPSAHTATAVGLAAVLIWLYPRGRWLFVALVVAVASQRIAVGDHYLSDTFWGAALGCVTAAIAVSDTRVSRMFARWEAALQGWRYWPFRYFA